MPKGVTNNPNGRPPKNRALSAILERAGAALVDITDGRVSGKKLLASMLWEAATTGKVTFPDDTKLQCDFDQWLGVAKFIYTQVDGAPKQSMEVTGADGGPLRIIEVELGKPAGSTIQADTLDGNASST